MKKIILLLAIALLAIQLVAAPNPSEPITAKLSFGDVNLPSGIVTGYNLTMQNDALLSVLGVESKAVYFIVGDEPAFYKKTTENNIVLFEVPFDEEINLMATAVTGDASDIIINGLPYFFAYGDRLGFDLNVNFDGSLYSILFGRANSANSITVGDNAGKGLFLYNDNSGNFVLLKDNNNLANYNLAAPKIITFRAPIAAGGENNAEAEARRIARAGARAEVNIGSCIDLDNAWGSNTPHLNEGDSYEYFGKQVTVVTIGANSAVIRVGTASETVLIDETKIFGGLKITLDTLVPLGTGKIVYLIIKPENEYAWSSYGYDETGTFLSDFCAEDTRTGKHKLNEVKCVNNRVSLEEHNCAANEECRNGACLLEQQQEVAFCYDSDKTFDDITIGNKAQMNDAFSTKGVVAGFYAAGRDITYGIWDDSCATANKLVEYSCKNRKTRFITVVCGSGCSDGKCANPPYCVDSDGGENELIKGKVVAISARSQDNIIATDHEDACIDNTQLREYVCDTTGLQKDLTVNCEFGCNNGRCMEEGEIVRQACTTKSDCTFSQACVNGFCSQCARAQDCGAGFVCSSPDKRCKPASGRCQTDTNCKIGKYCNPRVGQLGFCENEPLNSLDDITAALTRRWKRINVYARVIAGAEVLHNLELPEKAVNGQACLVDDQCNSNECSPDTGTCAGAESNANPDELDPDTNAGESATAADAAHYASANAARYTDPTDFR